MRAFLFFGWLDRLEIQIEMYGETAVATVLADMAGVFTGQAFDGHYRYRYRYIRTWQQAAGRWQVIAASVCIVNS
ncbi:MAG TPA: hypothetical protein VIT92_13735 [Burkholderiaceae bacterium]